MTVLILIGTETGNSLDFATRLSEDFERLGLASEISLMDDFALEGLLDEGVSCVLFICSTTGDGEEPRTMKKFMKFLLRADLPSDLFSFLKFGVFGLGDSSYDKFNFVGKRVYRRMQQLGASDMVGFRGEGDERSSKGIEEGWDIWSAVVKQKLGAGLCPKYGELEPLPPRCSLSFDLNGNRTLTSLSKSSFNCSLVSCDRVTPQDHFQDVRLLRLKVEFSDDYKFQPGDILNLKPSNDPKIVSDLMNLMGWSGNGLMIFGINGNFTKDWLQEDFPPRFPMTLKSFITEHVDLQRIPSKSCLKTLACLCDTSAADYSKLHQEKLLELSRDEGEYLDYVWRPKRTIIEIFRDFQPTLKPDLSRILQIFYPMKPRQFSIANDPKDTGIVELLIALIKEESGIYLREGLCSKWIKSGRIINEISRVSVSRGSFNYSNLKPVLFLFAAGTGIAPLRSIIQKSTKTTKIYLYFGCRSLEQDFYFREEWKLYPNLEVFASGSRDANRKVYLNHIILNNRGPLLSHSIDEISCLVSGHSRLNKLVQDTLKEIHNEKWLEELKSKGQYQTETWS